MINTEIDLEIPLCIKSRGQITDRVLESGESAGMIILGTLFEMVLHLCLDCPKFLLVLADALQASKPASKASGPASQVPMPASPTVGPTLQATDVWLNGLSDL